MKRGNFAQRALEAASAGSGTVALEASESIGTRNSVGPYLLLSGYAAANDSPSRGYLYWPDSRPRFEMTPLAAREIRRRIHWLFANFGFARRLILGMAQSAGTVTPFSDTIEPEWDELVEENFMERATAPEFVDVAANFDFWTAQIQLNINRWKDGDSLVVATSPEGYDGLQLAFYEAPQITDEGIHRIASISDGNRAWSEYRDGVRVDKFGKRIAFHVRDAIDPDRYAEISAADCFYYANLESHHAARGISVLTAAVLNMVDVVETRGFTKKRLKEDVNVGKVIEQDLAAVPVGGGGLGGQLLQVAMPMPDGSSQIVNWQVASGGGEIPRLGPGQRVRVIADDRPTPNAREFEETLLRDCSYSANKPYEALFNMGDLKGPASRFVLAEIRRWVQNQLHYQSRFVRWYRALHIANEIKAGRLPKPREIAGKPLWWLRTAYVGQADMTIDEGRRGNLALVNLESGLTTWAKEWGELGTYWKNPIRQRVREIAFAMQEAAKEGLDYTAVFPKLGAAPLPLAAAGDNPREPNPSAA